MAAPKEKESGKWQRKREEDNKSTWTLSLTNRCLSQLMPLSLFFSPLCFFIMHLETPAPIIATPLR